MPKRTDMTRNYLQTAIRLLKNVGITCAIVGPNTCYTSTARGIAPLLSCYKEGKAESGCCAADKVVGKAAAYMYVLLGVKSLYAEILSQPALRVLQNAGIDAKYEKLVDAIVNRTGTGFCPMETAVLDIDDPLEAMAAVEKTLEKLRT